MSGKLFECGYGAILNEDAEVLEACLLRLVEDSLSRYGFLGRTELRVCEIGMHDGGTALGIERFVQQHGLALQYWGIDPDDGSKRPRSVPKGGAAIVGDSAEVFGQVPDRLDLVWVDGCHCMNHVVLDTLHYAPKVRPGGFILYHDVNPLGGASEHQHHGPKTPEFGLAVNQGLRAIRFPWWPWRFFAERIPEGVTNCGTRAYRKGGSPTDFVEQELKGTQ